MANAVNLKLDTIEDATIRVLRPNNPLQFRYVRGFELLWLRLSFRLRLVRTVMRCYKNPMDWFRALKFLYTRHKDACGAYSAKKIIECQGKYYMGMYIPALFTKEFDKFIHSYFDEYKPVTQSKNRFEMVFMAVTNHCPLRCEHCYNWNYLNTSNQMDSQKFTDIVEKLQGYGVHHMQFSGGEPVLSTDKICDVVQRAKQGTDFWLSTSGFSLTSEKAKALKDAGVSGVIVSLDHYEEAKHNEFRRHKKAFYWVERALQNAQHANLFTALSLCITPEFARPNHLSRYMSKAKELGVMYVQFLESKSVGHYRNQDVQLSQKQLELLEKQFIAYNSNSQYSMYPMIIYPGYYQRRVGCMHGGYKGIYIDANGHLNPCPFCHKSYGDVLNDDFHAQLHKLVNQGCKSY